MVRCTTGKPVKADCVAIKLRFSPRGFQLKMISPDLVLRFLSKIPRCHCTDEATLAETLQTAPSSCILIRCLPFMVVQLRASLGPDQRHLRFVNSPRLNLLSPLIFQQRILTSLLCIPPLPHSPSNTQPSPPNPQTSNLESQISNLKTSLPRDTSHQSTNSPGSSPSRDLISAPVLGSSCCCTSLLPVTSSLLHSPIFQ